MAGRFLKIFGLLGGGVLALGTGAVGSHFAQPILESSFYPERKNREELLKQSLESRNEEIEVLRIDLQQQTGLNELQQSSIKELGKQLETLDSDLKDKIQEAKDKDEEISRKEAQIQQQIYENQKQTTTIGTLQQNLKQKEQSLTTVTNEKTKIEGDLKIIKDRLDLTREQILTGEALKWDLLKVDLRKIEFQSFSNGWAEFKVTDRDGSTTNFKVHKDNKTNHESMAEAIRQKGMPYVVKKESLDGWDKKIKITRFDADFGYKWKEADKKRCFVKNENKDEKTITITDYFNGNYLEEAFKVYIAIALLGHFPLEYDTDATVTEKRFYFHKQSNANEDLVKTDWINWDGFGSTKDEKPFFISTHMFNTIDDFLRYWAKKTIDFVRTGTVDFLDFLNPVNRSKYYESK